MKISILILALTAIISIERAACQSTLSKSYGLSKNLMELWKKDKNGCLGHRIHFSDSVTTNKLLIGLSKKEILKLLGKPDRLQENNGAFIYFIGTQCDIHNKIDEEYDSRWLVFLFERNKLVQIVDLIE